jgi:ATP/ADP translocase
MDTYYGFSGLIILILDIWAIVTVLDSHHDTLHKVAWCALIVVLPVIGLIAWFLLGKRS